MIIFVILLFDIELTFERMICNSNAIYFHCYIKAHSVIDQNSLTKDD